jgi:hypothetical protein
MPQPSYSFRWGFYQLFAQTMVFPFSGFQVARITGKNHCTHWK